MGETKAVKTTGRDEDSEVKLNHEDGCEMKKSKVIEVSTATAADARSKCICAGLGGAENITGVTCCATRLRCTLRNTTLVDEDLLKAHGAFGVIYKGNTVQVIYGPRVTMIRSNLEDYLEALLHGADAEEDGIPETRQTEGSEMAEDTAAAKACQHITKTIVISSPVTGVAVDLSTVPDEAFASRMLGDGAAIIPTDAVVRAPEDGEVCFVFETKQAVGFQTDSGLGMLIHIGIDTVLLNGSGFEVCVENGQKVKKGDPMLKLNLDYLKANTPSVASPVLCTELKANQKVRLLREGPILSGEPLFAVDFYA